MLEKKYRVYRYQNLIVPIANYIGKTCKKNQPYRAGKNGDNYVRRCPKFGQAIIEYGWPNFEYSVLADNLTKEEADELECYYINYYDSVNQGYNTSSGGVSGASGVHRSDEVKKRMSIGHLNHPALSKIVLQFTKDGQFIAEYPSIAEASRQTGISQSHICSCCGGKQKTAGGFIWKYVS